MAHPDIELALTLARNSRGFLAVLDERADPAFLQDRFHRLAISLELALKCYLILHGHTDETNRAIGHDLRRAAAEAHSAGLSITPALEDLIADTHPFFMNGGFHRERRDHWRRDRADRATEDLAAIISTIVAPIGAA